MKIKQLYLGLIFALSIFLSSCSSHECEGVWETSYIRPTNNRIRESWAIKINNDGTCIAIEEGSGDVNYQYVYYGAWEPVNDDCIYMVAETEPMEYTSTYSTAEIEKAASKARTRGERARIAGSMSNSYKTGVASRSISYYLWRDGKVTLSPDYNAYTRMTLNKR